MKKQEFMISEDFAWETPVMEEFKVLSHFHGADESGNPGPSFDTPCNESEEPKTVGEWE